MWNGSPASQVNWITWWTRCGRLRKLPHRAGGEDEREQHHARADQADEELQRRVVMMLVAVPVIVVRVAVIVDACRVAVSVLVDRLHAGRHRHVGRRLRIEHLAEQQHQRRSEEREQRDQPDLVEKVHGVSYHFSKSISSASTVSLLRNSAIRMPSPTAASATASVITKMAKICPLTLCRRAKRRPG